MTWLPLNRKPRHCLNLVINTLLAEVRIPNHVGDNLATVKEVIDFFAVIRICEGLLKAQLDS